MFDIEVECSFLNRVFGWGKPTYYVGWRNAAGFGPIADFNTYEEAQRHLNFLKGIRNEPVRAA